MAFNKVGDPVLTNSRSWLLASVRKKNIRNIANDSELGRESLAIKIEYTLEKNPLFG